MKQAQQLKVEEVIRQATIPGSCSSSVRTYLFYLIVNVISKGFRISVCQNKLLTDVSSASKNNGYVEFNQGRQQLNVYRETRINNKDIKTFGIYFTIGPAFKTKIES